MKNNKLNLNKLNSKMITIKTLVNWGGVLSYDNLPMNEGYRIIMPDGLNFYFDVNKTLLHKWHPEDKAQDVLLLHSVWGPEYVRFMDTYRHDKAHIKSRIRYLSCQPQNIRRLNLSIWRHIESFYYSTSIFEKAGFSTRINMDNACEAAQIIHLRNTYTKDALKLRVYIRLLSKM